MFFRGSIFILVLTPMVERIHSEPISCHRGQYHDQGQKRCLPCPAGTFVSHDHHQFVDCQRCSKPDEYQHEITMKNCTAVSDTIIGCHQGYFRQNRDHYDMVAIGECEKCSECGYTGLYEVQPCTQFSDTVCCPEPDMLVVPNQHGKLECEAFKDSL